MFPLVVNYYLPPPPLYIQLYQAKILNDRGTDLMIMLIVSLISMLKILHKGQKQKIIMIKINIKIIKS